MLGYNGTNAESGDITLNNISDPATLNITGITQTSGTGGVLIQNIDSMTISGNITTQGGSVNLDSVTRGVQIHF